ncbi:Bni4p NDAI_0F03850 [Naumovozyma dairenensis CBS 421]|uniref:Protein BNI4 n=1 Tax=Naumovozyma dairenensis (strain ATCC 10597 / BCRC 20456 / CBS 421 / NBRC 0211 / NRRL Y-12639) TaxID=1071378 RepID=G0WD42_NAUDC|nr:hypothetical protein NDAI_0F03850 [Naumovozyma dairenensis CBS 421]CCD25703.1 hypothetical protein NDAI_0F03850 [Naumovozyma dairenensis CBS 421]
MPETNPDFNPSDLLHSTFYSSNTINTLDHARTLRNSLIFKEMSDQSISDSLNAPDPPKMRTEDRSYFPMTTKKVGETDTVNMTTSPSLTALANILNEKSKNADQKMRRNQNIQPSIIEEEEEEEQEARETNLNPSVHGSIFMTQQNASPNLIDIDDSNNMSFAVPTNSSLQIEQPDYLTTPKEKRKPSNTFSTNQIQETIQEASESIITDKSEHEYASIDILHNKQVPVENTSMEDEFHHETKSISVTDQTLSSTSNFPFLQSQRIKSNVSNDSKNLVTKNPTPERQVKATPIHTKRTVETTKKRKSIFSFLKKKNSKEISTNTELSSNSSSRIASSSSIPEKLTKRSQSSNGIFNSFRKTKQEPTTQLTELQHDPTPILPKTRRHTMGTSNTKSALGADSANVDSIQNSSLASKKDENIKMRNPTPLSLDLALSNKQFEIDDYKSAEVKDSHDEQSLISKNNDDIGETQQNIIISSPSKYDSGEVLFPKSLDEHEVDSIVTIERKRSTKRSSITSNGRSLADTLSIKAQNEGMFITEAASVVLSTPDLTKSPASSILRNGRFSDLFDSSDNINTTTTTTDDNNNENTLTEMETEHRHEFNSSMQNEFSLGSIEERLNELTLDKPDDKGMRHTLKEPIDVVDNVQPGNEDDDNLSNNTSIANEDQELMSDIMEFANIINFGDEIDLNLDLTPSIPQYRTFNPAVVNNNNNNSNVRNIESFTDDDFSIPENNKEKEILTDSGLGIHFDTFEKEKREEEGRIEVGAGNEVNIPHDIHVSNEIPNPPEVRFEQAHEDEFEYEDFNRYNGGIIAPPTLNAYSPELPMTRPISMSFRGLHNSSNLNSSPLDPVVTTNVNITNDETQNTDIIESKITTRDAYIRFEPKIILYETYGVDEYDRNPELSTCNQLTPQLAQMIKAELNELKSTMEIHESSRCYTHFY